VSSVAARPSITPFITGATRRRLVRRNAWAWGIYGVLVAMLVAEKIIHPSLAWFDIETLVIAALPLALAAMAQTAVVLVGGIDLSIGPMMALVNVVAATAMVHSDFRKAILQSLLIIAGVAILGALTGLVITVTRVPDIIVTLATSFIWSGLALRITETPGGGVPLTFSNLVNGGLSPPLLNTQDFPEGLLTLAVIVVVLWVPWYRSRIGLSVYAVGSNRTAAFLSGVDVARTRIAAYAFGGVLVALAGLSLTAATSTGDPNAASNYTLNSVAAVVMGGVSLAGGKGGMLGPVAAAFVLNLIITILEFLQVADTWAVVIQGTIVVLVVLFAGLLALRKRV
jgi:ribose transport system permease protein